MPGIINSTPTRLYDPTNPEHQRATRDLATGLQGMIAAGQEGEAKRIYNEKQNQYGFTNEEFAPTTSNMGVAGATGFTGQQVGEWAANPATPPIAPKTTTVPTVPTAQPTYQSENLANTARPASIEQATPWNVTPEQTVEGRINRLIDPNSPLIQQARTRAAQEMNQRGLINSSIGMTAADAAAYEAALPIANVDASTFAKAAGYNADVSNVNARMNAQAANEMTQARLQAETQRFTSQLSSENQQSISELDSQSRETISAAGLSNQQRQNYQTQLNGYYSSFQNTLYQNSINPNLTPEARYIANMNAFELMKNQYRSSAIVFGLPDVSADLIYNEQEPTTQSPTTQSPTTQSPTTQQIDYFNSLNYTA